MSYYIVLAALFAGGSFAFIVGIGCILLAFKIMGML